MTTLVVTRPFGAYTAGQTITDPATVAAIEAGPNSVFVVPVTDGSQGSGGSGSGSNSGSGSSGSGSGGSGSNGGSTPSPGVTLAQVDTEIASALTTAGLPPGATVPALITAGIAAQGTGSGVSSAQAAALALVLG